MCARRLRGLLHKLRKRLLAIACDRDTLRDQMMEVPADGDPNAVAISIARVRWRGNGGMGLKGVVGAHRGGRGCAVRGCVPACACAFALGSWFWKAWQPHLPLAAHTCRTLICATQAHCAQAVLKQAVLPHVTCRSGTWRRGCWRSERKRLCLWRTRPPCRAG